MNEGVETHENKHHIQNRQQFAPTGKGSIMLLTSKETGAVTLGKERHLACMEAAWELEALAYALPALTSNSDNESTRSSLVVRGIAGRCLTLAELLVSALHDDMHTTEELLRCVLVTRI